MHNIIRDKIRAGYPGLFLVTHEEGRAEAMIKAVTDEIGYELHAWSVNAGRFQVIEGEATDPIGDDALSVLDSVLALPEKSVLVLRDYHEFFDDTQPILHRKLKDALIHSQNNNKTIILLGATLKLPQTCEKLVSVLEFALPSREELRSVIEGICTTNSREIPEDCEPVIDALGGMTTYEATDACTLAIVETDGFDTAVISREKSNVVKKNGLLEIVTSRIKPEDIGGLEVLKGDLQSKRNLFTRAARDYGLTTPRGYLVVGQPGTGKSLTAEATGGVFNVPLLRLEAGKLFGSHVGESEGNWRSAFGIAKAIAPCVLWIDEADGLFSGSKSSGTTDGGTTARVTKAILQDMQFNGEGIFFMFTANDIEGIPDPLVDRLDVWSVDLPTQAEREAIWSIHIAKRGRKPGDYKLAELAKSTEGYSGRQIEQVWLKAMTLAFNDGAREPSPLDIERALTKFVATSTTMAEVVEARRKRLQGRATPASTPEAKPAPARNGARKLALT